MDSVYKYGYCHRYRPGIVNRRSDHSIEPMGQQQWSDGFTTNWCPSDNRDNWDNRKELSEQLGWTDSNIRYRFNEYGYRHQGPFVENRNSIVFLGCSLTFGIGVNYEQTWPYYVSKELGLDCVNLAQPGTGINASYRAAKVWLPIIKPKVVMFYVPNHHRRELWPVPDEGDQYADYVRSIGPWQTDEYVEYFKMYISKRETDIWREAYLDAMRWIARDSIYIHFPATTQTAGRVTPNSESPDLTSDKNIKPFEPNTDKAVQARDMIHPGPVVHRENIAPLFIGAYRGWSKKQIDEWRKENL